LTALLLTGFGSGLPLLLVTTTWSARLARAHVGLEAVGLLSLVALPYSLKFLWAPLLDRFQLGWLGRRRGWMAAFQIGLIAPIAALGFTDPVLHPALTAALAFATALLSASLDVVSDAYNADVLEPSARGAGSATFVLGYRVGMLVAGGAALVLADLVSWSMVYGIMALLMLLGALGTFIAPEPPPAPVPVTTTEAVLGPVGEFFQRSGSIGAFLFILLYRVGDNVAQPMLAPFLIKIGFSNTEIGSVNQGVGLVATIAGTVVAGLWVGRLGVIRALFIFGCLQALTNLGYGALSIVGNNHALLFGAVAVDYFCTGLATTASVAFLMGLCDRRYSATQLALFTSAAGVIGRLMGAGSGHAAASLGWPRFFAGTALLGAPALALLVWKGSRWRAVSS
jgi:MFS transporter, PAT family, beta-lactamase induction signal transducer AmpG